MQHLQRLEVIHRVPIKKDEYKGQRFKRVRWSSFYLQLWLMKHSDMVKQRIHLMKTSLYHHLLHQDSLDQLHEMQVWNEPLSRQDSTIYFRDCLIGLVCSFSLERYRETSRDAVVFLLLYIVEKDRRYIQEYKVKINRCKVWRVK